MYHQKGQSLIETIGAIFVLTMALTAMLGVMIYAFSRGGVSQKEVVAVNLAREGIDVVRMMRDTNWLAADVDPEVLLDPDCGTNPPGGQNGGAENGMDGKPCYPSWLNGPAYDINHSNDNDDFKLIYTPPGDWALGRRNGGETFHLCLEADGSYQNCDGLSSPGVSLFARRVMITEEDDNSPYTPNHPLIRITSAVIWSDKSCPSIDNQNPVTFATPCKVVTEELMTNWKDYR